MTSKREKKIPTTFQSIRDEQFRLKLELKQQEAELRSRVKRLPGEIVYAGIDAILPKALGASFSDKLLNGAKKFINSAVVTKTGSRTAKIMAAAKRAGIFFIFKTLYQAFRSRKKTG